MWKFLGKTLKVIFIIILAFISVILLDLIVKHFYSGFIYQHSAIIRSLLMCLISLLCVFGLCLVFYNSKFIYKLVLFCLIILGGILFLFYLFNRLEWFSRFKSISQLREYIVTFNSAWLIFLIVQFFQVVILPIPSVILTGAGVLLFGPFKCAILSCIGVILGSILSFLIGRLLGYKFVKWFFGKDLVDKWLDRIESKSKLLLIFAFLFPFFPDDTICTLSGITKIKFHEFLIIVFLTRITSIFVSCFTLNNDLLPLNKWWGVLILIVLLISSFILINKYIIKRKTKNK